MASVTRHNSHGSHLRRRRGGPARWPKTETNAAITAACLSKHSCIVPGQWRWRWDLNPRKTCAFTRFRVLRTTVHHCSPASLTSADRRPASAGEQSGTGVNETQTEPQPLVREPAL